MLVDSLHLQTAVHTASSDIYSTYHALMRSPTTVSAVNTVCSSYGVAKPAHRHAHVLKAQYLLCHRGCIYTVICRLHSIYSGAREQQGCAGADQSHHSNKPSSLGLLWPCPRASAVHYTAALYSQVQACERRCWPCAQAEVCAQEAVKLPCYGDGESAQIRSNQ